METETETQTHLDLPEEQAYLDRAYECLEDMRHQAAKGIRIVVAGDPYAEEAIYQMFLSRLVDLSEETALCFGRIDQVDGDLYYIGRRHVHDENLDPVVIDWRAPVAEAFYQASWDDPWELERRRSFLVEGRRLMDISDEVFAEPHAARGVEAAGPLVRAGDALLAELGLHRAAYLLYSMRAALGRTGVLIVGPNRAFMRYVERVLPDLGETTVVQKAIDELASVRVERDEPDEVARQKGDVRMAEVLRRALVASTRPPSRPVSLRVGLRTVSVSPGMSSGCWLRRTSPRRRIASDETGSLCCWRIEFWRWPRAGERLGRRP